jgi:lipid II:glycine glycyltransferase (peptidoglycan interpeptide bridge formation enzyme)
MHQNDDVKISDTLEDPEWDNFVLTAPGGHHVQTGRWAQVRTLLGWKLKRIIIYRENSIVGGAQVLIRSLPWVGNAGYVTKGPLVGPKVPDVSGILLKQIMQVCLQNNCQLIAIQPANNDHAMSKLLESYYFCQSSLELAPTASLVIDLNSGLELIMKQMHKKVRQHIRRSESTGIVVSEGGPSDLDTFYHLYMQTARRQRFTPYKREYFDLLWQKFFPPGWIALLIARYQNEAVSAELLIPFGNTVIAKMIGWSGEYDSFRPNEAIYWGSIRWAFEHGYRYFDFEGINPLTAREILSGHTPALAEDTFKCGFGGQVVLYPPAYDYVPNKVFDWVYRRMPPEMEGNSIPSRFLEYIRKR